MRRVGRLPCVSGGAAGMERGAAKVERERRSWPQRLWPIAPGLLVLAAVANFVSSPWDAELPTLLLTAVLPIGLAIAVTGVAIGGRRGALVALLLVGFAAYMAWWFAWGLDGTIAPFSVDVAATGLADAAIYEVALFVNLWPFVLVAAIGVAVVARRRGQRAGTALGLLTLAFLVFSLPGSGEWTDTCNETSGATPLVTAPATQELMDHGVGVLPGGVQTMALCEAVGNRNWKPFWLGDDDLPPKPHLNTWEMSRIANGIQIPKRLDR